VGALLRIPETQAAAPRGPPDAPRARLDPHPPRRASPAQIPRAGSRALDGAAQGEPLAWPVRGVLISGFGDRDRERHDGVDLAAPEGTPVLAADGGQVLFAGEQRGYGNLIVIGHGRGLVTVYAHNSANLVAQGDRVERGQPVARIGRTGNATGPHLHFEVRAVRSTLSASCAEIHSRCSACAASRARGGTSQGRKALHRLAAAATKRAGLDRASGGSRPSVPTPPWDRRLFFCPLRATRRVCPPSNKRAR